MITAIVGARGFVGQHLTATLVTNAGRLRVVGRTAPPVADGVEFVAADLTRPATLETAFAGVSTVVNLAWPGDAEQHWAGAFGRACVSAGVSRLVHVSTATVAGATTATHVDESTACVPVTPYEQAKLAAEADLIAVSGEQMALAILRPTAVIGARGRNLVTLADSLLADAWPRHWARASLFGRRPMHLVPVATVVDAVQLLVTTASTARGVFIVAADADPENDFRSVEARLRRGLGLPPLPAPPLPVPVAILEALLQRRGRSDTDTRRRYVPAALQALGFIDRHPVGPAVEAYGAWYRAQSGATAS